MLTPTPHDITIWQGMQFNPVFGFFNDKALKNPFDLSDYAATLTVGNILVLTSTGGDLTLGGLNGQVQVFVPGSRTATLPAGSYPWFLEWHLVGGQPDSPVGGTCLVTPPSNPPIP